MIIEILTNTPTWVFVLFFVLLYLGISRTKTRVIPLSRAVILPIVMIVLSLSGVVNAFHSGMGLVVWVVAVGFTIVLSQLLGYTCDAVFDPATRLLSIPGSWLPLSMMMTIFFIKYGVAVALALNSTLASTAYFVVSASVVYGLVSGLFLSGAISIWKAAASQGMARTV